MNNLYATIDMGTHSSILSIVSFENQRLKPVFEKITSPNTGASLGDDNRIPEASLKNLKAELIKFLQDIARLGARLVKISGTHVFRVASNGADVMQDISRLLGAEVEVLTGEREAELVRLALSHQFGEESFSVIDIGGGSTEVSTPKKSISLPIGAVNLFEKNGFHPDQGNRKQIAKAVKKIPLKFEMENLMGIGGSLTTLAMLELGLKEFDAVKINGLTLGLAKVSEWIERLADLKPEFRAQVPGLPKSRVNYIGPGLCLMEGVMQRFNVEEFKISTWGLRNGLALEYIQNKKLA